MLAKQLTPAIEFNYFTCLHTDMRIGGMAKKIGGQKLIAWPLHQKHEFYWLSHRAPDPMSYLGTFFSFPRGPLLSCVLFFQFMRGMLPCSL